MDYRESKERDRIRERLIKTMEDILIENNSQRKVYGIVNAHYQEINSLTNAIYSRIKLPENKCSNCKHLAHDYLEFCGKHEYNNKDTKFVVFGMLSNSEQPCKSFEIKEEICQT